MVQNLQIAQRQNSLTTLLPGLRYNLNFPKHRWTTIRNTTL